MSAIPDTSLSSHVAVGDGSAVLYATVSWTISRSAARLAFQGLRPTGDDVVLHLDINLRDRAGRAWLCDDTERLPLGSGEAPAVVDGELAHFSCTIAADTFLVTLRGTTVLYASTTLLARRGVKGGRYEVARP